MKLINFTFKTFAFLASFLFLSTNLSAQETIKLNFSEVGIEEAKQIQNHLNKGNNVELISDDSIIFHKNVSIVKSHGKEVFFNIISKGTIKLSNSTNIRSTTSKLNLLLKTDLDIIIPYGSQLVSYGGEIRLQAHRETGRMKRNVESHILLNGWLNASGAEEGGRVIIESDEITLNETANIFSQGSQKGGTILIGGDWQGGGDIAMRENEEIYEAISVDMKQGAVVDASATCNGNGGKVVVWSNINHPRSHTAVQGTLLANGGTISGKGGKIETSGGAIDFEKIKVSTIAADGSAGEWLIDPWNFVFNSTQLGTLATNLAGNNIAISTANSSITNGTNPSVFFGSGHIVFQAALSYTNSNARTLTLTSNEDIWINSNISSSSSALSLVFNAPSGKRVLINGDISTNGGSITINNASTVHFQKTSGTQTISSNGGAINFGNSNIRLLRHSNTLSINSGSGQFNLGGTGNIEQVNTFFDISATSFLSSSGGWGGAHASGSKTYGITVTSGREYSAKLYFWDSWDNERGELVIDNGTWHYYFTAHRTHGATTEMTNIVNNFGTQYQITGPAHYGGPAGNSFTDVIVDVTFVAQHTGILTTWTNLNQAVSDESLEIFNIWETYFPTNTNFTSGSRSLELITTSGQLACGTKNFTGLNNLTFNTNNDWGFTDGIISGATNVIKSGTGSVRFSGETNYTGTTTVNAGTFRFAPWYTSNRALSGNFVNNGTVTYETGSVNNRPTIYLDGVISGSGTWNISSEVAPASIWNNRFSFRSTTTTSGQINITGHGNLWLEGSNINMTSPIFLDGANSRLRLYGPANATMSTGQITGTGTVDFADGGGGTNLTLAINTGSNNHQFDGVFANSGSSSGPTVLNLRKDGTGTYTLTGNNTYSGTTLVNSGTLQIGHGGATGRLGSGAVTVATNSTLNFNLNTATSFNNGFNYSAAGATIANTSSTSGAMITLSGGVNAGTNANTILDGGTAGITVSGAATPAASGAGVWIKGDVTFTGSDLSGLVISCAGSGSTMRFKTTATPWWFGSTNATNAPNIVVDAGVTVSQNVSQAAGSLFYNNLSGSGTISLAGSAATHTILGESSVANLSATSSIALVVGQGGSTGSITSGNITANNGITLNSTTSYTFSGILAGTTLTKQNTNTVTLTGTNTNTGATTISGGTLQLGNNGTTGSIGSGNIVNNGTLTINRSDNVTLANTISGTGVVNKLNNTTATFTANNSYTGATNITGTLVLQNNAPTSSSTTYQGTGQLRIESSGTTFTSAFSTTGWTFGNTLSGLTIGKTSNTSDISFNNGVAIAGTITAYANTINLNATAGLSVSAANAEINLYAKVNIDDNATQTLSTNNGNVRLIADEDANGSGTNWLDNVTISCGSGNVLIRGEHISFSNTIINGSGTVTVEPSDDVFGGNMANNGLSLASTITGFTFGKPSNTADITVGTSTTISGPVSILGGNLNINENINTTSGGTNGDILLKATTDITFAKAKTISSSGGDMIFWSDADGNGAGDIFFASENNYSNPVTISTGGGHLWMGGGSSTTTWNGLTVGNSYAVGNGARTVGGTFTHYNGITLQATAISTSGGHIQLKGRGKTGDFSTTYSGGMYIVGAGTMNSGGGNIDIEAIAQSGTGQKYGFYNLGPYTFASGAGNLTIFGDASPSSGGTSNTTGNGVLLWSGDISTTGNINISGKKSSVSGTFGVYLNVNIATSGINKCINIETDNLNIINNKTIASPGQLVIKPLEPSTTIGLGGASGTLSLPASYFSTNFADGFSNIQIGSNTQTGNISSNAFTLRDNMTFLTSGSLTLGGKPVLGSNNVTLGSAISSISAGANGYFQTNGTGVVNRTIANNTNLLFPIGNAVYNPVSIANNTGASDVFTAKVRDEVLEDGTSGITMRAPHVGVTWDINKTNANTGSGIDFTVQWNDTQETSGLSTYKLNHYNSSTALWGFAAGNSASPSGTTTKTMTHTGYTGTFSPFAVGSDATPLPVTLLTFEAEKTEQGAKLTWITANEINNSHFEVLKSIEGKTWEKIGEVTGAGTSYQQNSYEYEDNQFAGYAYYKLRQVDFDGNYSFSPIRMLSSSNGTAPRPSVVYPNPSKGSVKLQAAEGSRYEVYDVIGKLQSQGQVKGLESIENLSTGVYTIKVIMANQIEFLKVIVE